MTQSNSTAPQPPVTETDPIETDPQKASESLLHLHKMSTTAGLGSQDYAEVNVTAVVAVLFGLASLLAIASPILLVFPIVGVGLSLIALRQVRRSNGTQTGAGLAILGLILSGAITAVIFSYQGVQALHRRADEQAIAALCTQYGQYIDQRKFAEAYDLFDADFQNRLGKQTFINQLSAMQNHAPLVPPVDAVYWNGITPAFQQDDEGVQRAGAVIIVHYKAYDGEQPRLEAHFKKVGDGPWLIDNIPEQFPEPRKAGAPPQG